MATKINTTINKYFDKFKEIAHIKYNNVENINIINNGNKGNAQEYNFIFEIGEEKYVLFIWYSNEGISHNVAQKNNKAKQEVLNSILKEVDAWGIDIWCTDVHTVTDLDGNPQNFSDKIEIGNHVWIGKDVKINKSTKISDDSIIGWGSIVTKKFNEPNVVLAGNPAKIVKRGINWNFRDLHNYQVYREGLKQN